jgi:hypothetical protein
MSNKMKQRIYTVIATNSKGDWAGTFNNFSNRRIAEAFIVELKKLELANGWTFEINFNPIINYEWDIEKLIEQVKVAF